MKAHKNSTLLLFFLTNSSLCIGQNWNLINDSERFHYNLNGGSHIAATIKVDSLNTNGQDSTFYLNRIVAVCDTCFNIETEFAYNCTNCLYEKHASQFGGKSLTKYDNGDWLIVDDEFNYLIKSLASTGSSWLANETVMASVDNTWEALVLGETDSLKSIVFDNNITMVLSKQHGITQFNGVDSFSLIGIKGRDLGALVPNFESVFNYTIGDVLQYHISRQNSGTFNYSSDNITSKLTLTSVATNDLSVSIGFDFVRQKIHWTPGAGYTYQSSIGTSSKTFLKSILMPEELYNHQFYQRDNPQFEIDDSFMAVVDSFMNHISIRYGHQANIGMENIGGVHFITNNNYNVCFQSPSVLPQNIALGMDTPEDLSVYHSNCLAISENNAGISYANNLGVVRDWGYSSWANSGGGGLEVSGSASRDSLLEGYIHDGVQFGVITSDSVLLAINNENPLIHPQITFFPNPTEDFISIKSNNIVAISKIKISDTCGRVVFQEKVNSADQTWNLAHLADGVYLLCVELEDGRIESERIVKQ